MNATPSDITKAKLAGEWIAAVDEASAAPG
jgi:hypothetical protein